MTTGDITLAPRPPSPWIVMTGQQAGQPTPAFYRFIINLLGQSNGTADLVLILEALAGARPSQGGHEIGVGLPPITSAPPSGSGVSDVLMALTMTAQGAHQGDASDTLLALALTTPSAKLAQLAAQIAALQGAQVVPTTFAGLPATPTDGQPGYITDGASTTFAAAAAGGGANHVPVYFDGTIWRIG